MGITFRILGPLLASAALTAGCNKEKDQTVHIGRKVHIEKQLEALDKEAKDLIQFVKRCKKSGLPENEISSVRAQLAHSIRERRAAVINQAQENPEDKKSEI